MVGHTTSLDFPLQAPYQSQNNVTAPNSVNPTVNDGNPTAFVTKLNPTGSALIYSTYLGGNSIIGGVYDSAFAVAVDSGGNAYVTALPFVQLPRHSGRLSDDLRACSRKRAAAIGLSGV